MFRDLEEFAENTRFQDQTRFLKKMQKKKDIQGTLIIHTKLKLASCKRYRVLLTTRLRTHSSGDLTLGVNSIVIIVPARLQLGVNQSLRIVFIRHI